MTYPECLALLAASGHELRGMKFDLDAVQLAIRALGNPERFYPTAIVAGTNGKGSTCAMLASILACAGYRTGLYTSPHLVRVNERIRISGHEISDEGFAAALTEVWDMAERQFQSGVLTRRLTYFELLTVTAFLHFAQSQVDFAVLEVGMGGRLDATNVTDPRVAVITNVDLDHEEILGKTRRLIAREKAGVIRPGRPVISGCEHPEAREVVRERCLELGAELIDLRESASVSNVRNRDGRFAFDLKLGGDTLVDLEPALIGMFQIRNAVAAVAAAWRLRREGFVIGDTAISAGLRSVEWPGRLEVIYSRPLVLMDGAHNPAAAGELATFIRQQLQDRRLRLVYASMRDKSIEDISAILFPLASEVYVAHLSEARAAGPAEILQRAAPGGRLMIEPDPVKAFERAFEASDDADVVLVAGSLYLVGAVKQALLEGTISLEPSGMPQAR
jgi:dihydrofolate synthase/folylpolyglutamate synthase